MTDSRCDVLVIGGGPAGATVSALLAERGRDVVLVEKARHPRFHIGESLLPLNLPLFERLGVAAEIASIGMTKRGVEFVSPWHNKSVIYGFENAWDGTFASAYQVRRSEFDQILFLNAVRKGARAYESCRVTNVDFQGDGASVCAMSAQDGEHRWQARFVIDASGRDTFLADQFGVKERNRRHNTAALFGHFSGARRLSGKNEGDISVFWFDHGWLWLIPLADGTTSIGAVCRPGYMSTRTVPPQQFLLDTIALCPALTERLSDAALISPVTATGNYSYTVRQATGRNYLMLGDALAFVDPVFSSGVFLAMHSAFIGADAVETCLDHPARSERALKAYDRTMRRGLGVFSWFIYRVTTPALRDLFMNPNNSFRMRDALMSVLAGDIFRTTPVGPSLAAFKAVYYLHTANLAFKRFGKALREWRSGTAPA